MPAAESKRLGVFFHDLCLSRLHETNQRHTSEEAHTPTTQPRMITSFWSWNFRGMRTKLQRTRSADVEMKKSLFEHLRHISLLFFLFFWLWVREKGGEHFAHICSWTWVCRASENPPDRFPKIEKTNFFAFACFVLRIPLWFLCSSEWWERE